MHQRQEGPLEEEHQRQEKRKKFRNDPPIWERRPQPPPPPQVKKKYRFKPDTIALREIQKYQKGCEFLVKKAPFACVIREIMDEYSDKVDRIQSAALGALEEARYFGLALHRFGALPYPCKACHAQDSGYGTCNAASR